MDLSVCGGITLELQTLVPFHNLQYQKQMKAKVIVENRATTTGRWSSKEPQLSNTPKSYKMTKEDLKKLLDELIVATRTEEFARELEARIREENERYEAWELEQRRLWHKYKDYSYDI